VKVIIYGDFNCLYCHLSSQRADRLVRAGTANVEWRAAEHRPGLPVTGAKPPPGGAGGDDDMAEAARLALPGDWLPAIDYAAQLAAPLRGLLPAPVPSDAAASVEA
jgi:hypothetical protein